MRQLPPLFLREQYVLAVQANIQRFWDEKFYAPLAAIARRPLSEITNSISALLNAARTGRIWYDNGQFYGDYTSAISREFQMLGARFHGTTKTWVLEQVYVPAALKFALADTQDRFDEMRRSMVRVLNDIRPESMSEHETLERQYEKVLDGMEQQFQTTVKLSDAITVVPDLTPHVKKIIAEEWATNLDLYIKGWTEQNILTLREQIQPGIIAGGRARSLMSMLQENYGVSKAKARFLAHQETSLLMSKFRQSRYQDIGIKQYRWSTSHDERVRHDHAMLNGKVFRFDQPPVTNRKTGAKNNPGEDFGCRCVAIGLI